jgi:hypothetical protein
MIRVEEELGQHFYLVTGSYEPVCEQSALFNAEQAQSRFRPGCTSLLNLCSTFGQATGSQRCHVTSAD